MLRSWYRRIKTKDGFTDFKHHAASWRHSKRLRERNRRKKIKRDVEEDRE